MIAPCLECSHRTVTPNCHSDCEQYLLYVKYRQKIRDARQQENLARQVLIAGAQKVKNEVYRHRKK